MGILEIGIFALYLIVCVIVLGVMVMHPKAVIGGVKKALSKLPKRPKAVEKEINDFTDWKAYAAQGRKLKLEAHAEWEKEAYALIQNTCKHIFHQSSSYEWFICVECRYEQPWERTASCRCQYHELKNISDPTPHYAVTERSRNCISHGVDWDSWPYSERKGRHFGSSYNSRDDRGYEKSKAISKGRSLQPVFKIKGTN